MNKLWSCDSIQLLREIDQKMSILESIIQQISGYAVAEEVEGIHQILLEVSQLLLTLQHDPKVAPFVKGLSLQLQNIQEQCNRLLGMGRMH
ncbi:hypothetical protein [Bacillus cereus]|uniref:hypothetical protein n=1 Tax=Bacillus cereus TaxID=1396 RepID=UPI000950B7A5|nr:hypothetical protein [Bacillus cereus]OLR26498.1 hypothetical protein BLD50_06710 [Bacillus cereus]